MQGSQVRCYLLGKEAPALLGPGHEVSRAGVPCGEGARGCNASHPLAAPFCPVKDFTQTLVRINLVSTCQEITVALNFQSTLHLPQVILMTGNNLKITIINYQSIIQSINQIELGFGISQKEKIGILLNDLQQTQTKCFEMI